MKTLERLRRCPTTRHLNVLAVSKTHTSFCFWGSWILAWQVHLPPTRVWEYLWIVFGRHVCSEYSCKRDPEHVSHMAWKIPRFSGGFSKGTSDSKVKSISVEEMSLGSFPEASWKLARAHLHGMCAIQKKTKDSFTWNCHINLSCNHVPRMGMPYKGTCKASLHGDPMSPSFRRFLTWECHVSEPSKPTYPPWRATWKPHVPGY